jgi:hypothetical protein
MSGTTQNAYDAAKFHVIKRKWFGLTKKFGGDVADGYTFASATASTKLIRWSPKGPIKILKVGHMILATLGTPATNADVELQPYRVYKAVSAASHTTQIATQVITARDTGREALFSIASKEGSALASQEVEAGMHISIRSGSPTTGDGTVDNGTVDGTVAFFIDYVPHYDPSNEKWNT